MIQNTKSADLNTTIILYTLKVFARNPFKMTNEMLQNLINNKIKFRKIYTTRNKKHI